MQETPATQYIFAPADPIYHIARNARLTLCGLFVFSEPDKRRRRDDLRLSPEKPARQFTALCSECDRKATGKPEPQPPSIELLRRPSLIEIVP